MRVPCATHARTDLSEAGPIWKYLADWCRYVSFVNQPFSRDPSTQAPAGPPRISLPNQGIHPRQPQAQGTSWPRKPKVFPYLRTSRPPKSQENQRRCNTFGCPGFPHSKKVQGFSIQADVQTSLTCKTAMSRIIWVFADVHQTLVKNTCVEIGPLRSAMTSFTSQKNTHGGSVFFLTPMRDSPMTAKDESVAHEYVPTSVTL